MCVQRFFTNGEGTIQDAEAYWPCTGTVRTVVTLLTVPYLYVHRLLPTGTYRYSYRTCMIQYEYTGIQKERLRYYSTVIEKKLSSFLARSQSQGHLRLTMAVPYSSYSARVIHMSWKVPKLPKILPPNQLQMDRSWIPGVKTLTLQPGVWV